MSAKPMYLWLMRITGLILAGGVAWADQAVKFHLTWKTSLLRGPIEVFPFFRFTYAENYGISLGLLSAGSLEMQWLLSGITLVIAAGLAIWILIERKFVDIIALALILGGALGNIRDRLRLGYVMDYADLHFGEFRPFLIFNLADALITIGVLIILARSLFLRDKPDSNAVTGPET